jgi:threonine dehydrogenase-like Zn-dependent dehydrogenase
MARSAPERPGELSSLSQLIHTHNNLSQRHPAFLTCINHFPPSVPNMAAHPAGRKPRPPRTCKESQAMRTMKAAVFKGPGKIILEEKPIPTPGAGEALVRITTTTICGTDVHILKGEYPVEQGLTIGHEPVGVIEALGPGVTGYAVGQRVVAGAITPCGQCHTCLDGHQSQCGGKAMGGWRFGNTIDGAQAECLLVPNAMANLEVIPDGLTDEEVLMCPDIMSTGFGGAESGGIRIGDTVVVFAQGPIGLCATAGAKLKGASRIIVVDGVPARLAMARRLGADIVVDYTKVNPVDEIMRLTNGQGADVAIEALGTQQTFESCLRVLKPGGTLSSLGVYSGKLSLPLDAFAAGLGDHKIITTLCPGGKERMRRLMNVVASGRVDLKSMVTHRFRLDQIEQAYDLFANQRDGVLKVAITP